MTLTTALRPILEHARASKAPSREECMYLLQLPEQSHECAMLRATADQLSRKKFDQSGMLLAQIGVETSPCPANCKFCSFARDYTDIPAGKISLEDIIFYSRNLTNHGNLHSLFLMTMHDFDFDNLLRVIGELKRQLPDDLHMVVNIGDFDRAQAKELRAAQIVSVVFLAGLECKELKSIAVHEPNELGLVSGANCIYAEAGANPRDTEMKTERSRGFGLPDCERWIRAARL